MKKFWKYLAISAIAVGTLPMVSCSDDETVDPYTLNYCYVYQPYSTFAQLEYKANGQFLIDIEDPLSLMPVRLTKPAPTDLTVTVAIDETLVDEYNQANGTDYEFLTGCSIINPTLHIKQGEYISTKTLTQDVPGLDEEGNEISTTETVAVSDSIIVSFGESHENFQTGHPNLMLPIVITSVNGGVTISKSSRIFLTFSSDYKANVISTNYLTTYYIDDAVENWETAFKNATFTDFFQCKWNADDPITISASVNNNLVAAYNEANATNYLPIDGTQVATSNVNIAAGENKAGLTLSLGDYTGVVDGNSYLVPIELSVVSGEGAELEVNVVYVAVEYIPLAITCYPGSAPYSVSQIGKGGDWTCQYTSPAGVEADYGVILNTGNMTNKDFATGGQIVVDCGAPISAKMFMVRFNAYYYAVGELEDVETSLDGVTWSNWGTADFGDLKYQNNVYAEFSKPATFRYIRFVAGEEYYGWGFTPKIRQLQFFK